MDSNSTINIQTTTNKYLAPAWVDLILNDNFFFGYILENTKKWDGFRMDFPKLIQKFLKPYQNTVKSFMGKQNLF